MELTIAINRVIFNSEIPADKFALPDEIRAPANKK
jgi:hypothetical protein